MIKQSTLFLLCLSLFLFFDSQPVYAYIGPGAGFVFITSFLMIIGSFFMVLFTLLTWPIRVLVRAFKNRNAFANAKTERVVILGLDGLEPTITERMLDEGKLPNLKKLQKQGSYSRLQTTWPALSPVAWSAFSTGVNPGRNNIFDFLSRNRDSYLPELSSAKITGARRKLSIGKYELPLGKPSIRFLRRSQSFWKILGDRGIFSHILRVPITFPPEKFNGIQLSAMCTPDLWGTQGTFSFFTTDESIDPIKEGGETAIVQKKDDRVEGFIKGPENTITKKKEHLKLPFIAKILNKDEIELTIGKETYHLKKNVYTDWIELRFKAGFGINVHGIARFYLIETQPHFRLYMTPINIDPEKPALPVSYPYSYSVYLSKLFGKYATLGLAEDTWSLNEGILDDTAFLEQAYMIHEERETQFFDALNKTKKGLCAVVIDATDRIQHMFFRTLDDDHPANKYNNHEKHKNVIEDLYIRMDDLVGRTMQKIGKDDVFIVLSDHGFKPFKRGINLNVWLKENGYLSLKDGIEETGDFLSGVDWSKTRAYAIGLAGIYINVKGREKQGVVKAGEEYQNVKKELIRKLSGLKDPQTGEVAITEMFDSEQIYNGPYTNNGPDLISGYNVGYRISWDGATGVVNDTIFEDNTKPWSGDHCIDPRLVPGIIFSNRKISAKKPALIDIAPTVLNLFGVEPPGYMEGVQIFDEEVNGGVDEVATQEVSEEISQKQIGSIQ